MIEQSVLLIQDGTDLNLATHGAAEGLGVIGRNTGSEGTLGLHLHSTMAVSGRGVPLGLMRMEFEAPEPPEGPRGTDRDGDACPIFDQCRQLRHIEVRVRPRHDRVLGRGGPRLFETMRQSPPRCVQAQLAAVPLHENPSSSGSRSLPLTAVHVQEVSLPGDGSAPLEGLLLTALTVTNTADAERVLNHYRLRWRTGDRHRILKSECKADLLNLQTAEQPVTIKGIIASFLHATVFSELEIQVLGDVA